MSKGLVISSLEAGRVDMVAAGLCITEARQQRVRFSVPYKKIAAGVFQVTDQIDDVKQSLFSSIKDSFYNNLIRESRYEQIGEGGDTKLFDLYRNSLAGYIALYDICLLIIAICPIFWSLRCAIMDDYAMGVECLFFVG